MPIVTFHPSLKTIEVSEGISLFEAAQQAGLPVASSCHGEFVCGRCNMEILKGKDCLSERRANEAELLSRQGKSTEDRISCATQVLGDCTVTTTYW